MSAKMEKVEVLYDYQYSDEQGVVEIRRGEKYRLIEKTNNEWWHVCAADKVLAGNLDGFFVPAQYVHLLKTDEEVKIALSCLDSALDDETIKSAASEAGTVSLSQKEAQFRKQFSQQNGTAKSTDTDTDYVNLEQYRADAQILKGTTQTVEDTECDYENLPFQVDNQPIPAQDQGPCIQDGTFVRVLLEGFPWDIYEDKSKRRFFYNRETREVTWKPPRKEKPTSPVGTAPITAVPCEMHDSARNSVYMKQEEAGDVFFVNNSTKEKGKEHGLWSLGTPDQEDGGSPGVTNRQSKAKSMYSKIEQSATTSGDPKTCTLPYNFSPSSQMEKSLSVPSFQMQAEAHHRLEDHNMHGYLNRAKIADIGKKKIKKNWTPAYVVLQSSNLVFYKDQKASAQKPGSPHGRPEHVVSLHGAQVSFSLPKDITSRRNTIMLVTSSGSQLLLHNDDEKNIHEWLVALKLAANDLAQEHVTKDQEIKGGTLVRKGTTRSMSDNGSNHGSELDRGRNNMVGIRAKLLNLLTRRPTQDELVKQGIIKDAVFGSSLQDLCERDKCVVPNFVVECIAAVENKGLGHDGLYRISGNFAEIQRLRCLIDKDETYSLTEDPQWDVHTLTGALKLFFRELKEPLFTFKSVQKLIESIKRDSRKDKLKGMQDAVSSLPKCNQETMRVLFQHLKNVVHFSSENRMQTQNIAIVFGPTLMWLGEEDFTKMAVFTIYQSKVVEFILLEYDNLFHH